MPPYRREILASSFMASKSGAACGNKYDNTIAAAAEKVEWPEGYAGKFGSPITVVMPGSSCTGRGLKYVYLTPQQPTAASCIATLSSAKARAARSEEHTSELQSRLHLVCRLLLEKKKKRSRRKCKD